MKKYLIDKKVPSEDIFMGHAGFGSYESIYRARNVFAVKEVIYEVWFNNLLQSRTPFPWVLASAVSVF
jgi:SanA protein